MNFNEELYTINWFDLTLNLDNIETEKIDLWENWRKIYRNLCKAYKYQKIVYNKYIQNLKELEKLIN